MSKLTQEQMQEILEALGGDLPTPYYFDFNYAVNSDYLSEKLAEKMKEYLCNRGYAEDPDSDWYSKESINDLFAILFCEFMQDLTSLWNRNALFEGTPIDLAFKEFKDTLICVSESLETDSVIYCAKSGIILDAIPINKDSVLDELRYLLDDKCETSKETISWLSLVNYNFEDEEITELMKQIFEHYKLEEKYNKYLEENNE